MDKIHGQIYNTIAQKTSEKQFLQEGKDQFYQPCDEIHAHKTRRNILSCMKYKKTEI